MKYNSKIRFQHGSFRRQLRDARGYKRAARKVPEGRWQIFFARLGLGSWWSKALAGAAVLGLAYLAFIPNFLFIKTIDVSGAVLPVRESVAADAQEFFGKKTNFLQRNIVFFSKNKLAKYIAGRNDRVVEVQSIDKALPDKISITVVPRVPAYLAKSPAQDIEISNDGQVLAEGVPGVFASSTETANLRIVDVAAGTSAHAGDKIFDGQLLADLSRLSGDLGTGGQAAVDRILLNAIDDMDIGVATKQGFEIKFTRGADIDAALRQLALLLGNLPRDQFNNLFYVDMRIPERSYVCLKNTPCTQPLRLNEQVPTATPDSLVPNTGSSTMP